MELEGAPSAPGEAAPLVELEVLERVEAVWVAVAAALLLLGVQRILAAVERSALLLVGQNLLRGG